VNDGTKILMQGMVNDCRLLHWVHLVEIQGTMLDQTSGATLIIEISTKSFTEQSLAHLRMLEWGRKA
jgi:hypothetical protein